MFSSFTSFLPSALHLNGPPDLPRPNINPDTEDEDEIEQDAPPQVQQSGDADERSGKVKDKSANETFIFVRPPPSKSNHPLNLQVQLVPPNGKPPNGVVSTAGAPTTPTSSHSAESSGYDGASLARTSSTRSDASVNYGASTTSFSSVASSSASSTSRRAIIPLYNLQAHNVLTNVIVDAGTDAKIAKFQKRGIELIDLALLEPVEVWGEKDRDKEARRESMRLSVDEVGAVLSNVPTKGSIPSARGLGSFLAPSRPGTPSAASSSTSLHSGSRHNHDNSAIPAAGQAGQYNRNSPPDTSSEPTPVPTNPSKRNIFKSLFNKKSNSPSPSLPSVPQEPDSTSTFGIFSLHPAPTSKISKDSLKKTPVPPSLPLLQPPMSPLSSSSQQVTPTEPQTPRQSDIVSPTPTVAPSKDKGHTRNSSLTSAIATSFKTPLRSNKKRPPTVVVHSDLLSPNDNTLVSPQANSRRRDASPNPSMTRSNRSNLSLRGSMNFDASSTYTKDGIGGYPLMLTQSQARDELTNLKQQQLQLRPPILGIQPTFVSAMLQAAPNASNSGITSPLASVLSPRQSESNPEALLQGQRALMYVWLVRKWLKRRPSLFSEAGLFGGLGGKGSKSGHSAEGSSGPPPPALMYGGVEVRFEWKRAKTKDGKGGKGSKKRLGRRPSRNDGAPEADSDDEGSVVRKTRARTRERDDIGEPIERIKSDERKARRMSTGAYSANTASEEGGGDESDPEDSETPWVCTLKMRRNITPSNPATAANYMLSPLNTAIGGQFQPQVLRIKVGTLSPTPHHPKVVAMLKVPFPLPDVQVDRMRIFKRNVDHSGPNEADPDNNEPYYGITLSAEEIKDMVCSTGLWLVVREGFGGVGRVSRKGDGWRIRA